MVHAMINQWRRLLQFHIRCVCVMVCVMDEIKQQGKITEVNVGDLFNS